MGYLNKLKEAVTQPQNQSFGIVEDIRDATSLLREVRTLKAQVNDLVNWKNSDAIPTMKQNITNITSIHTDITKNIVPTIQKNVDAVEKAIIVVNEAKNEAVSASTLAQKNVANITSIHTDITNNIIPQIQSNINAINGFPTLVKNEVDKVNTTISTIVNNKINEFKIIIEKFVGVQINDAKITLEGFFLEQIKQTETILQNYVSNQIIEVKNVIDEKIGKTIDTAITTVKKEIGNWVYSFVGNPNIPLCDNDEKTIMGILCNIQGAVEKGFLDAKAIFEKFQSASAQLSVDTKLLGDSSVKMLDSMTTEITVIKKQFMSFGTNIYNASLIVGEKMKYLANELSEGYVQIKKPLEVVKEYGLRCKDDNIVFLPYNVYMAIYWGFMK